jgi:hypothetical protein
VRRIQWEAGSGRSVRLGPQAYKSLASSGVGFMDGGSAIGLLRSWVENLAWRRLSKIQEQGYKTRRKYEELAMATTIKGI